MLPNQLRLMGGSGQLLSSKLILALNGSSVPLAKGYLAFSHPNQRFNALLQEGQRPQSADNAS